MKKDLKYLILHNENDALEYLDELYGSVIRSIIKPILKDDDLMEDCLNEIWFRLSRHLEKLSNFDSKGAKYYICTTARNTAFDFLRKCKPEIPKGKGTAIENIARTTNSKLLGVAIKHNLPNEVFDILDSLDPLDRNILLLHRYWNLTYKEVGEELGISEANASKRMQRIKVFLRNSIGGKEV